MLAGGLARVYLDPGYSLFDHLVGKGQKRRRNGEPQRLGGDEIDDEDEFGGLLDRNVAGLRPVQNFIDPRDGTKREGSARRRSDLPT